jgi:hypothetical protein
VNIFFDNITWLSSMYAFRDKIEFMARNPEHNTAANGPTLKLVGRAFTFRFRAALSRDELNNGVVEFVLQPTHYVPGTIYIPGCVAHESEDLESIDHSELFSITIQKVLPTTNFKVFLRTFANPIGSFVRTPRLDGGNRIFISHVSIFDPVVRSFFKDNPRQTINVVIGDNHLLFSGMLIAEVANLQDEWVTVLNGGEA